jgi:hypothetical protein
MRERIFVWVVFWDEGPGVSNERMPIWEYPGSALVLVLTIGTVVASSLPAAASPPAVWPEASAPDLVLTRLTMTPANASEDEVVHFDVTIKNQGDFAAWTGTVTFVDVQPDGGVVTLPEISLSAPLNPQASVVLEAPPFVLVGAGEHVFMARVSGVSPPEANTANNALPLHATVRPGDGVPPPPTPSDNVRIEALAGLGIGGLIVVVLLAIVGWTITAPFRGPGPPEESLVPPPPEPPDRRPPPIWPL